MQLKCLSTILHNAKQVFICIDQLLNAVLSCLLLEKAWSDETFSAHCHRWRLKGLKWPAELVDLLMFFDRNHCMKSYESEKRRSQLPPELRK